MTKSGAAKKSSAPNHRGRQSAEKRANIAARVNEYLERKRFETRPTLARKVRQRAAKPGPIIAYDLETTRIAPGTPRPLYITAYGATIEFQSSIRNLAHLTEILLTVFLTEENLGARFVAWNGNRFDAFIIAVALIRCPEFVLKPYLTRTKTLRGIRVLPADKVHDKNAKGWEFLDGIAMLGLPGVKLAELVSNFAPKFPKLIDAINFEKEEFDPKNKIHCAYAMRDSEGLYHAMMRAESIMLETFGEPLGATMGGTCIKIFCAHIPREIEIDPLVPDLRDIVQTFAMRGGYCYCVARYRGPVWKYDINQAYAAAMREAALPAGGALHGFGAPPPGVACYLVRLQAIKPGDVIPFYYRSLDDRARVRSRFDRGAIADTWLTSVEHRQLISEGWQIECSEFWAWSGSFDMPEFVDRLETLRTTCDGGPSGPIGTMVKATGNHSFGKLAEVLAPIEFVLAAECPDDFEPFYGDADSPDPIEHVYYRFNDDRRAKAYHQMHVSAWITAHVRMVLRRAALLAPDDWLYADTDCVVFARDVTSQMDIDSRRYGAWKVEESGTRYEIIAKKVYRSLADDKKRSAKGLHVGKLTGDDFAGWFEGKAPVQGQTQLQNFLSVMRGADMFGFMEREGTRVEMSQIKQR